MKPSTLKPLSRILVPLLPFVLALVTAAQETKRDEQEIQKPIDTHRPSRLAELPPDFNAGFGATHSDGKYHLTNKPFFLEGAGKLLNMGTRLGKFWFSNDAAKRFYSFNSNWPETEGLVALAETPYFQELWKMPFQTLLLNTTAPSEKGWPTPGLPDGYYDAITRDYFELRGASRGMSCSGL